MFQIEKPDILHERTVTLFTKTEVSALQIKTLVWNEILTRTLWTLCVTQREMETKWKEMSTKRRKSHENIFCLIESHGIDKKNAFLIGPSSWKPVKQRFLSNNLTKFGKNGNRRKLNVTKSDQWALCYIDHFKSNRLLDWLSKLFKVIIKRCQLKDLFWRKPNLLKKIW